MVIRYFASFHQNILGPFLNTAMQCSGQFMVDGAMVDISGRALTNFGARMEMVL